MMRTLAMAILCFSTAAAAAPSVTAREVDRLLGGYEHVPGADEVKRLGPGADQILIAVAGDARVSRLRRTRAVAALRFVPSAGAHAFLLALIEEKRKALAGNKGGDPAGDGGSDPLELAAALGALAPYGLGEVPLLSSLLAHASADVRQSAAATLGLIHADDAMPALHARLLVERDSGVRLTLARALESIQAPR